MGETILPGKLTGSPVVLEGPSVDAGQLGRMEVMAWWRTKDGRVEGKGC